jgi:hypothetical protein
MKYYKAHTMTQNASGDLVQVADIKASDRNYSHAVITTAFITNKTYTNGETNPAYGRKIHMISFHQGLENAQKAADSNAHRCLGGGFVIDQKRRNPIVPQTNHNRSTTIVTTEEVSATEYRHFKKTALIGSQLDALLNA